MSKPNFQDRRGKGFLPMERFVDKIDVLDNGCWQWLGSLVSSGYGMFSVGSTNFYAHRFSYLLYNGELTKPLHIDHLCRNRGCVNPEHLELVTMKENILRGEGTGARNARKTHCKRGHEFTPDNIRYEGKGKVCRTCNNEFHRVYDQKKRRPQDEVIWRITR